MIITEFIGLIFLERKREILLPSDMFTQITLSKKITSTTFLQYDMKVIRNTRLPRCD